MKKKAAIISLYGNENYGNKLQNYAVQEILKQQKLDVDNIINIPLLNNKRVNIKIKIGRIKFVLKSIAKKYLKNIDYHACLDKNDSIEKQRSFLEFNNKIHNTKRFFSFYQINKFNKYDYYFVGSDQVWNPNYGGLSDLDMLTFTKNKKISLAASFGVDQLSNGELDRIKKCLNDFTAISVREEQAKNIINSVLPDKKVEVLVDPTMILTTEDWNKITKKPNIRCEEKYILCYFLGEVSDKRKKIIKDFAKKNMLKIIDIFKDCEARTKRICLFRKSCRIHFYGFFSLFCFCNLIS